MSILLEISVESLEGAKIAEQNGADRIELCSAIELGGLTPSWALMSLAKKYLSIPIFALIRPRSGDFLYSEDEFQTIIADIVQAKVLGLDGIVIGFLLPSGNIDIERTRKVCELAKPMQVTFNRAFDLCKDSCQGLEDIITAGCSKLLTSGQAENAEKGIAVIKKLVIQSNNRISIIAGAGVKAKNVNKIIAQTKVVEVHTTAKMKKESNMEFRKNGVSMGNNIVSEFSIPSIDKNIIKEIRKTINTL